VESIMSGLVSGINAANLVRGLNVVDFPDTTIIGSLSKYLETENENFQPMNANFGILPPLEVRTKDKTQNKLLYSERSLKDLEKVAHLI